MARALLTLILLALLPLPTAHAVEAFGEFFADGPISLPRGSTILTSPIAIYYGDSDEIFTDLDFTEFEIHAATLRVTYYQMSAQPIPLLRPGSEFSITSTNQSYLLHDVRITLAGPPGRGYVGLDVDDSRSRAEILGLAEGSLASAVQTQFAAKATSKQSNPDNYFYYRSITTPHVLATASGAIRFEGGGVLKLSGLVLDIAAAENKTTLDARKQPSPGGSPFLPAEDRWLVLESEELQFNASSAAPWIVAGRTTQASWNGGASFRALNGSLSTAQAVYKRPNETSVRLDGALDATIDARLQYGSVRSMLTVRGDLSATNLAVEQSRVALPGASSTFPVLLGVVLGVVLGGSGGVLLWRRHHRTHPRPAAPPQPDVPLSPALAAEYYVGLAEQALQFGEHAKALHYISLAREAAPASSDVATTMAFVLGEMGHYDEALAAYEEASRLDPSDGEADLNAARLAAQAGKPIEEVESFILRALERSPEFVFDVEEDVEFRPLAIRPAFRQALARAWDRWGGEEPAVRR